MGWKIPEKTLVDPQDNDSVPFDQEGIVKRSTWSKIKAYILGTTALTTNDKTITGAMEEIKKITDDNATQLSESVKGSEFYKDKNENANINAIAKSGFYYYGDNTTPNRQGAPNDYGGVVEHKEIGNSYAFQKSNTLDGKYFERVKLNGTWGDWKEVVASITPTEYPIPYINSLINRDPYKNTFYKNQFNEVTIISCYKKSGNSDDIASGIPIFTLPVGYRPNIPLAVVSKVELYGSGNYRVCDYVINTDGTVICYVDQAASYAVGMLFVTFIGGN